MSSESRAIRWTRARGRAFVGMGLIVSSTVGVWWVVNQSTSVTHYIITTEPVFAGTALGQAQWDVVALGSAGQDLGFLRPEEVELSAEKVVTSDLPAGVLVSHAQLREYVPSDYTTFTTRVSIGGAPWLARGAHVEVWVAAPQQDQGFSVPQVVAPEALVTGVRVDDGFAADSTIATIDLLVHRRQLPALVHASANSFDIQVSPVTGMLGQPR